MRRETGECAVGRGIYHSDCKCRVEMSARKGDRFPACPRCQRNVTWLFTRSYVEARTPPPGADGAPGSGGG